MHYHTTFVASKNHFVMPPFLMCAQPAQTLKESNKGGKLIEQLQDLKHHG